MADAEQEAKEERGAHAVFDAEQQCRREATDVEEESDDDDFDWIGPDLKEKAARYKALVASFETLKKTEDDANEALQQRLLEDASAHRALATTRRAAKKLRRERGNDRAMPSTAPRGDK
jgi:hypothetical protein